MAKQSTYIIEETAIYYVKATSKRQAERKFLKAIRLAPDSDIQCEIPDREVYRDPEQRLTKEGA